MAPRLSVVVPIYNVQRYLDECLSSIAAQTLTDFEVVMVDDGSTDDSAAIAEAFAAKDQRFRLVRQQNKGLGPARNTGIAHIDPDAEYLAFVDSDDTMPPTAYQLMVETLDSTGSDFVSGNVLRFRSVGFVQSPVHRRPFSETVLRTHITERPLLVTDRTAWNKVYRRTFWDAQGLEYPGILYEDAPVSVPLHFLAKSVDILSEPIYHWREREVGARSITQNRTDPRGLIDRVSSMRMVREFLQAQPGAEFRKHLRFYNENSLVEEVPLFFKALPEGGEEYQTAFLDHIGSMISEIDQETLNALPAPMRLKYWLTSKRRLADLLDILAFDAEYPWAIPLRGTVRHFADYPTLRGAAPVPDSVLRLDSELVVRTGLFESDWRNGRLHLKGFAYPKHLGAEQRTDAFKALMLREQGTRRTLVAHAKSVLATDVTATTQDQSLRNCDWSGFELDFDPNRLKHRGQWRDGLWQITIGVFGRGRPRRSRIKAGPTGSGQFPAPTWVTPEVRVIPQIRDQHLYIQVETVKVRLDSVTAKDDGSGLVALRGRIVAARAAEGAVLRLHHKEAGSISVLDFPVVLGEPTAADSAAGWVPFTVLVDPEQVNDVRVREGRLRPTSFDRPTDRWSSELVLPGGEVIDLAVDDQDERSAVQIPIAGEGSPRVLYFKRSPRGHLQLVDQPAQPLIEKVSADPSGTGFLLEGSFPLPGRHTFEWVLRHNKHAKAYRHQGEVADGRFSSLLPALPNDGYGGELPLQGGEWEVFVSTRIDGAAEGAVETTAHIAPAAHVGVPVAVTVRGKEVTLRRRWYDRLLLDSAHELSNADLGRYHQRRLLQEVYPAARRKPLRESVLYDVFEGKSYSDSPRAVHQELVRRGSELEHLWVVRDDRMIPPAGASAVVYESTEWYEALARSRYIVGNTHLPSWIERREGQVIIQTWHGTPLKRIGFDFDNDWFSDTAYLEALEREGKQWSLLVSPNSFSTPILKRAFRYEGEILASGYPRNDVLLAEDREKRAEEVRRFLGLPEGKKIVLYAPTWREDRVRHAGGHQLDLRLDLQQARKSLGDDHVLLVRPHAHVVEPVPGEGDGFVWDVGSYPDIQDLYLIADVLVTDYSSVMFDYAITGRPILFFTYDLEHYRDALRGFYFDFEATAPGPLLATSEELVAALRDLDPVTEEYAPAYRAFREKFCDLDDGSASRRVVDRMLGLA
ncbi:bifunctional glycosyltransferase/CDP-glycerol:glycerophosphate glycerophosphotransferase [Streptacidiphilus albus]|uniref:bifunctional glycosyltransferase/CDP-glycerol:glycerophosphate glycerophosphotransferase n=1 Tax=Streptacidiphilus albus TaxID=105425 RepID=UPI00054C27DE|nr:bifunctional glycosyltransferase family 2 protein/CDP-glycerol:glycerophosphate glycerophosphotransferase [Streptacidiphilus albus]